MLAHTTYRHFIIGSQLMIGIALLSASYFSEDSFSASAVLKANTNQSKAPVAELTSDSERC